MDWPSIALITYVFLLVLLLTVLILRSRRNTKTRYLRLLEEKEQELTATQIDLEEMLQSLTDQASDMEARWGYLMRQEQENAAAVQERIVELQGNMMELQSRLLQLERAGLRSTIFSFPADREPRHTLSAEVNLPAERFAPAAEPPVPAAAPVIPEAPTPAEPVPLVAPAAHPPAPELLPEAPEKPKRPRVKAMKIEAPKAAPRAAEPLRSETVRQAPVKAGEAEGKSTALELLEAGWSADQIARALRCSRVEVDMLVTQWKRGNLNA